MKCPQQEPPVEKRWQGHYLSTKFFVPVAPHPLIARPRLFSLLDEGRGRPLTLVSAPAGFSMLLPSGLFCSRFALCARIVRL